MPVTGIGSYNPTTFILGINISEVYSYWDAVFQRKFVNPEPSHGAWGLEETEAPTIYIAEDVENIVSGPHQCDEIINSLTQKAISVEDLLVALLGSPHVPIMSSEDIIVSLLAKRLLLSEDVILTLLAKRIFQGQDIVYERPLLYRSRMMAFPIFGGSHVIQVKGEEE
jgi:hypothetical protein